MDDLARVGWGIFGHRNWEPGGTDTQQDAATFCRAHSTGGEVEYMPQVLVMFSVDTCLMAAVKEMPTHEIQVPTWTSVAFTGVLF